MSRTDVKGKAKAAPKGKTTKSPAERAKSDTSSAASKAGLKVAARSDATNPRRSPKGAKSDTPRVASKAKGAQSDATKKAALRKEPKDTKPTPNGKGRALVIVESPTKSRTLVKFLGRGFSVLASNGHIMDLPKSELGVDVENDFEPKYVPIRGKSKALAKIKEAAKSAERIFLAPDPDREGEAIAWHLAGELKSARRPIQRLTFNEITERAVKQALEQPRNLDMNLVNAQQARRVLDRLVGYKVSPFVWRTVRYGLSAGRVQSVALRMICEREEEIRAFVPEEYWTLEADFETEKAERFTARLHKVASEELESGQLRGADAGERTRGLAEELARAQARIASVETTPRQVHPKAPFITSTLQQTAFNRLGFSSQRTMAIAQQLYEGVSLGERGSVGLITYMRTDSPRLAGEAIAGMREWIGKELGPDYLPDAPRQFKGKKSAQDAHEAIRPSDASRTPASIRPYLNDEQWKLYDLIWKRAVASQTASAEYLATTVEVEAGRLTLKATGRVLKFAGFQKLYGLDEDDDADESRLPELAEGQPVRVAETAIAEAEPGETIAPVRPLQHFTQPPPRYSEASLVKALEEQNIGRPSTYATIVGTITSRAYVTRDRGRLAATDLGEAVNRLLVSTFPDVFQVDFTARMEEELDEIEEGKQEWHQVVKDFWGPFSRDLGQAEASKDSHRTKVEQTTDIACPNCGRMLVKKFGRRGPFLACPGYPECKYTRPVDDAELPVPVEGKCELCGSSLVMRNGPYGRFIACSRRPDCKYTRAVTLGIKCPECGLGELAERRTKRGKIFYGCNRYPECKFASWDKPRAVACPSCAAPFLVEKETKKDGLTLRCLKCGLKFQPETVSA